MSASGRHGRQGDEMFFNKPTAESPTIVEPLRIQKRSDTASPPNQMNAQAQSAGSTHYPMPALPYPDDRARQDQQNVRANGSPAPYPIPDAMRAGSAGSGPGRGGSMSPDSGAGRWNSSLAERRGTNMPKPLPESPGPEAPEKDDGLFQRPVQRTDGSSGSGVSRASQPQAYPMPTAGNGAQAAFNRLNIHAVNRMDSTASTATTRATRGSPPPPETPVMGPGQPGYPTQRPVTDIEQRYAASGIAGDGTLTALQAQSAAAQARAAHYQGRQPAQQQQQQQPPPRPWTPTEQPGASHHPAPTVYQGMSELDSGPSQQPPPSSAYPQSAPPQQQTFNLPQPQQQPSQGVRPVHPLENDMSRLHVSEEPPPAYSSVSGVLPPGQYPNEKSRLSINGPGNAALAAQAQNQPFQQPLPQPQQQQLPQQPLQHQPQPQNQFAQPNQQDHPAFANDPRQFHGSSPSPAQNGVMSPGQNNGIPQRQPSLSLPPASPPPLPEGWIAHLDPNSGQYYYIHLPSQSTQWEFPKGPTPLNLNETPMSPTLSAHPLASPGLFSAKPLASPGLPMSPGYGSFESQMMSASLSNPATFTGPPPSSGVDLYKVNATNGVYFGPYLRYVNMDLENGVWYGSIMLVTDAPQPPTIHLHQSVDLSPNPRQLKGLNIAKHQRWTFYKYEIDIRMDEGISGKWTYAITSHLGCTRYEFMVAGKHETNWRFIATSNNDFAITTSANERARLGGVGYMWKDIMQKHAESGGFHVQLGCGGQISADRLWKEIPSLKQWLAMSGKENRKNIQWTAAHEEDVSHAYFHYYTSHFDQPFLREAFAQIPHVCTIDDHDIFDGFGSYPDYMQFSNMFKNIGRIGIEMYLLFQHHTTLEILRNVSDDRDLFTITGTGWHFVKFLGPAVAVVGPDTRSERTPHQVMAGPTYQGLFPKIAMLPQCIQHCILMISVPVVYPRLESMEQIASTVATGKKAVTGAYNVLGKVTSSVAGVVGAKGAVGSGFDSVKRAVGKSGLMGGILNPFGDIDVLDELKDQWTHESKDLERTYLIRTLQGIAKSRSIRITFLSGAVNTCGAGLFHDPSHPSDHKTMYQLISSSVVAAPPSSYVLKLLNNNKPLYVPANGTRSTPSQPTDTKEDMMELFVNDAGGQQNVGNRRLMARRNYVAIVAYDPDMTSNYAMNDMQKGAGKLSLAADFLVQGDGAYGGVVKFGPVIIPSLEYGR